jgi:hypothetical protein
VRGLSRCRDCGRDILWSVVQESGKNMPLEPVPSDRGTVVLTGNIAQIVADPKRLRVLLEAGNRLYVRHHLVCKPRKAPASVKRYLRDVMDALGKR